VHEKVRVESHITHNTFIRAWKRTSWISHNPLHSYIHRITITYASILHDYVRVGCYTIRCEL